MKILAIETSCDETGISIIDVHTSINANKPTFTILADMLTSQAALHSEYGGVYPTLAKREHIKALPLLLEQALEKASIDPTTLDAIVVTHGPGLEPALWTGITFAQELAEKWGVALVPINHMEGHIYSTLLDYTNSDQVQFSIIDIQHPAIALLISGGHTELILIKAPFDYEYLGGTVDDAVGEAFDKAARMLGLGYPGGPIISNLAQEAREMQLPPAPVQFPRPMMHSKDCNFSFSGLKTAVLYYIKKTFTDKDITLDEQRTIAREFEDACAEVLAKKTADAMEEYGAETLIIGGGVAANSHINETIRKKLPQTQIYTPGKALTGDNSLMIAIAGYYRAERGEYASDLTEVKAHGTLKLQN